MSVREKLPIEPIDMENAVELLMSPESSEDSFRRLFRSGGPASERKKWSSLTISLLMHCTLALAFYSVARPHLPSRHNWIEVELVASCGGLEGKGPGPSLPSTQIGEYGSKAGESDDCPPLNHESVPRAASEADRVPEKQPVRAVEDRRMPYVAPVKERTPWKKTAKANVRPTKEEPTVKAESNDVKEGAAPGNSNVAVEGPGPGASSGVGPGPPGQPAGNGMSGPRGDGPGEVAFGSPGGPRFLHKVMPCYPSFARKLEKEGAVLLRVAINEEGQVVDVEILKKAGFGFDEAAVKAIRESTFIPAKRDGRSFSCKALLPIRFELKSSDMD
jgi:TonB family protein